MSVAPERDWTRPLDSRINQSNGGLVTIGNAAVPVIYQRSAKARRYILSVRGDGSVIVTVPRGGSRSRAEEFLTSRSDWVERTLRRIPARLPPKIWTVGSHILFRGELVMVEIDALTGFPRIRLGAELFGVWNGADDVRPVLELEFRRLAEQELTSRVRELAQLHNSPVRRIIVRNQRSRWGSCSQRGTISVNWRLIQAPPHVRDYIILHELMHFREMNHSPRFWLEVQRICPGYRKAEAWLSEHRYLLEQI